MVLPSFLPKALAILLAAAHIQDLPKPGIYEWERNDNSKGTIEVALDEQGRYVVTTFDSSGNQVSSTLMENRPSGTDNLTPVSPAPPGSDVPTLIQGGNGNGVYGMTWTGGETGSMWLQPQP